MAETTQNYELIANRLMAARMAYYNSEAPIMSDSKFDLLEDELRANLPDHPYFSFVGVQANSEVLKIAHSEPMLSMDKVKTLEELKKWLGRLALPEETLFCIQPKIDGLSASCRYHKGRLAYIATRGDGKTGQEITGISRYMRDIPMKIDYKGDIEIRGELYLPKNTTYDTKGKPLRNNCVGLINRKEGKEDVKHVRFVAYQIISGTVSTTESGKVRWLANNGFHTVDFLATSDFEEIAYYYEIYLKNYRDEWLYETDGLVITVDETSLHKEVDSRWLVDHHHHYCIAIKPPALYADTELEGVDWQVSRQGTLVPVALLKAVTLGGTTVKRASLHNYENVKRLNLQQGDILEVERANDVIPYIRRNISNDGRGEQEKRISHDVIPERCPCCAANIAEDGVNLKCENRQCPERRIQEIIFWVKSCDMDNISKETVRNLYNAGKARSISEFYGICPDDLIDFEGFAEKSIANFIEQIEKSRRMSIIEFISRLGIPAVQEKSLRDIGKLRIKEMAKKLAHEVLSAGKEVPDDFFNSIKDSGTTAKLVAETDRIFKKTASRKDGSYTKAAVEKAARRLEEIFKEPFKISVGIRNINDFLNLKDVSSEYAILKNIVTWLKEEDNQSLIRSLLDVIQIEGVVDEYKSEELICMTGTGPLPRKEIEAEIRERNGKTTPSVTRETTLLLCDNPEGNSSKLKKARSLNIPIMTYDDFFQNKIPGS